jgi:cyclophilin family peptidyl-prolyl cis-trans isomerase
MMKTVFRPLLLPLVATLILGVQNGLAQDTMESEGGGSDNPMAVLHTSLGDITLELLADAAPVTVDNFVGYAQDGFYDGTIFHRVISHFMIQGGGMTPDLKPKATRDPIVNESSNGLSNTRGTVAMARTSMPDSATSQFFINVQDNTNLDRGPMSDGYAVFARVTEGMEVVDEIRFVETTSQPPYHDVPVEPVVIESVEIFAAE